MPSADPGLVHGQPCLLTSSMPRSLQRPVCTDAHDFALAWALVPWALAIGPAVNTQGAASAPLGPQLTTLVHLTPNSTGTRQGLPGELDRFSEFTGDGSLEATFPEQGVYRLDLIPVCGAERHRGQHDNRVGRARLGGQRRPGPGQRLRQSPGSYADV